MKINNAFRLSFALLMLAGNAHADFNGPGLIPSGSFTNGHCIQSLGGNRVQDSGGACGGGVSSLNSLTGSVTIAAGANVTVTPSGNTLTIASSGGGGGGNLPPQFLVQAAAVSPQIFFSGTYNNGTAGVGATLTAGSNGAFNLDGVAGVLNDLYLIAYTGNEANAGIYQLTTVGTGSTKAVLTRYASFNSASNILAGTGVTVSGGTIYAGSNYILQGPGPYTIGTTALNFIPPANFQTQGTYQTGSQLVTSAGGQTGLSDIFTWTFGLGLGNASPDSSTDIAALQSNGMDFLKLYTANSSSSMGMHIYQNNSTNEQQMDLYNGSNATYATFSNSGGIQFNPSGGGLQIGSPTGGNEGAGTLNVSGALYVNGVEVESGASAGAQYTVQTSNGSGGFNGDDNFIYNNSAQVQIGAGSGTPFDAGATLELGSEEVGSGAAGSLAWSVYDGSASGTFVSYISTAFYPILHFASGTVNSPDDFFTLDNTNGIQFLQPATFQDVLNSNYTIADNYVGAGFTYSGTGGPAFSASAQTSGYFLYSTDGNFNVDSTGNVAGKAVSFDSGAFASDGSGHITLSSLKAGGLTNPVIDTFGNGDFLTVDATNQYYIAGVGGAAGTDPVGNVFTGGILTTLGNTTPTVTITTGTATTVPSGFLAGGGATIGYQPYGVSGTNAVGDTISNGLMTGIGGGLGGVTGSTCSAWTNGLCTSP